MRLTGVLLFLLVFTDLQATRYYLNPAADAEWMQARLVSSVEPADSSWDLSAELPGTLYFSINGTPDAVPLGPADFADPARVTVQEMQRRLNSDDPVPYTWCTDSAAVKLLLFTDVLGTGGTITCFGNSLSDMMGFTAGDTVTVTGTDGNSGLSNSAGSAFKGLQWYLLNGAAGDTLFCENGTYTIRTVVGTNGENLAVRPLDPATDVVTFTGDLIGYNIYAGHWQGRALTRVSGARVHYDRVDFDFYGKNALVFDAGGRRQKFTGCTFDGNDICPYLGHFTGGDTLSGCSIHNFSQNCDLGAGFMDGCEVYGNGTGSGWDNFGVYGNDFIIRNSIIRDNTGNGIHKRYLGTVEISNCLIYNNSESGFAQHGDAGGGVENSLIAFNTFTGNGQYGYQHVPEGAGSDSVYGNIMYGNGGSDFYMAGNFDGEYIRYNDVETYETTVPFRYRVFNIGQDPAFINAGAGNFRLNNASPCISLTRTAGGGTDLEGTARPQPAGTYWDMGCYENTGAVAADTIPPDNDMTLTVFSYDADQLIFHWTPVTVDSADRQFVGLFYTDGGTGGWYPDTVTADSAVFVSGRAMSDTMDTVTMADPLSVYWCVAAVRDSSINWSSITSAARDTGKGLALAVDSSSCDEYGTEASVTADGTVDLLITSSSADSVRFQTGTYTDTVNGVWSPWYAAGSTFSGWDVTDPAYGGSGKTELKYVWMQVKNADLGLLSRPVSANPVYYKNTKNVFVIRPGAGDVGNYYLIDIAIETTATLDGDTIEIRDDSTYQEDPDLDKGVYVRAQSGKDPVITAIYNRVNDIVRISDEDAVLYGIRVDGGAGNDGRYGVYLTGGSVIACTLANCYEAGLYVGGSSPVEARENVIRDCSMGMYTRRNGWTFRNNTIRDSKGTGHWMQVGIHCYSGGPLIIGNTIHDIGGNYGAIVYRGTSGKTVADNLIYNCARGVGYFYDSQQGANLRIVNNTILDCSGNGVIIRGVEGDSVYNNIIRGCGNGSTTFDLNANNTVPGAGQIRNNDIGTRNTSTIPAIAASNIDREPAFADTAADDFRLTRFSPCINGGWDPVNRDTVDIRGIRRPAGYWDMGAYEYEGPSLTLAEYRGWRTGYPQAADDDTLVLHFDKPVRIGAVSTNETAVGSLAVFYGYGTSDWEGDPAGTYAISTDPADSTVIYLSATGEGSDSSLARCLSLVRLDSFVCRDGEYDSLNSVLDSQMVLTYSVRNERTDSLYLTLNYAHDGDVTDGDTLMIMDTAGVYWERMYVSSAHLYFRGAYATGKKPEITNDAGSYLFRNLINQKKYGLERLELNGRGGVAYASYADAGTWKMDSCVVHDFSNRGLWCRANRNLSAYRSVFYNCPTAIGISYGSGSTFRYNTIYDCGTGISTGGGFGDGRSPRNHVITDNLVYDCTGTGLNISGSTTGGGAYNLTAMNNTVYGCAVGLILSGEDEHGNSNVYLNNIAWGNGIDISFNTGDDQQINNWTFDYNCYDSLYPGVTPGIHDVMAWPGFRDTALSDFSLSSASSVINKAQYNASSGRDIRNTVRPAGYWDIGAYEYEGPSPVRAVFYGWQTPGVSTDDSLIVHFDKTIRYGGLNTDNAADANFRFYGYGASDWNDAGNISISALDSTRLLLTNSAGGDSILARTLSAVRLDSLAVTDGQYDSVNAVAGSVTVVNYSVWNATDDFYTLYLQEGIDTAATGNGDSLVLLDTIGIYRESADIDKRIALSGPAAGRLPVIDRDPVSRDSSMILEISEAEVHLHRLAINGNATAGAGVRITRLGGWDNNLYDLDIYDISGYGNLYQNGGVVYGENPQSGRVIRCRIRDFSVGDAYGVTIKDAGDDGKRIEVGWCELYNLPATAIYHHDGARNNYFHHNLIYDCGRGINTSGNGGAMRDTVVYNTIYGCSDYGIQMFGNAVGTDYNRYRFNVCLGNTDDFEYSGTVGGFDFAYNCYGSVEFGITPGTGDVAADPVFADSAGRDFHLRVHSPCIDAGDTAAAWNDYDGSRCDLGAYGGAVPFDTLFPRRVDSFAVVEQADAGYAQDSIWWSYAGTDSLAFFAVYRGTDPAFVPGEDNCIDSVLDLALRGRRYTSNGTLYYYKISMVNDTMYGGGYRTGKRTVISLAKRSDRILTVPGDTVTYTIYYDNDGDGPTRDTLRIYDELPARTAFLDTAGAVLHASAGGPVTVRWYDGSSWSGTRPGTVRGVQWSVPPGAAAHDGTDDPAGADDTPGTIDTTGGTDAGYVKFRVVVE